MTGCLFRHGLSGVRASGLPLILGLALGSANTLRAADGVPANSPSSNALTASLAFQETGYHVAGWSISLTPQSGPFAKEPAAASGRTIRGVLNFGGSSSNAISFLWQRDARKLFLDLNRNRDLTDDAAGAVSASAAGLVNYQTFTNVQLNFNTAAGRCRVLADLNLYDYGNAQLGGVVEARSFWQGRVTLNGRDWQAGIVQNGMDQPGSFQNGQLLLRPWEKRNLPFTVSDGSLATVPLSQKLFVDGRAWQLDVQTRTQNGEARPALRFTEQTVALGEIRITGKFIQRLVLPGGPYQVVLDQPAAPVKIPAGIYNLAGVTISLAQNGAAACLDPGQSQMAKWISVNGTAPAILNAGGPLTNSVTATRDGQDLRLDYKLIGAGGAAYRLANRDSTKPPEFAIYQGGRKIASGKFEFG